MATSKYVVVWFVPGGKPVSLFHGNDAAVARHVYEAAGQGRVEFFERGERRGARDA